MVLINSTINPLYMSGRSWLGHIWFLIKYQFTYVWLGSDLPQHLNISALPGEVGNEVSKQCCDAGRHPWASLSPSLHTANSSPADGSAQPLHSIGVTQGPVDACPTLAQIRGADSARHFSALWNIWAGDQREILQREKQHVCSRAYAVEFVFIWQYIVGFCCITGAAFSSSRL